MSKYIPTVVLILSGLAATFATQITSYTSKHSAVFGAVSAIIALIAHYLPSPAQSA